MKNMNQVLFIFLILFFTQMSLAQNNYTIDEEGNYIYEPIDESADVIEYDNNVKDPQKDLPPGVIQSDSSGAFQYEVEQEVSTRAIHVKFASLDSPDIVSKQGITFGEMYGTESLKAVLFDYEWKTFDFFGKFGLVFGTGLITTTGQGRFLSDPTQLAEEEYTFIAFPNHLSLIYRFQFKDDQIFIPYVMGGAGYFAIVETRDDGAKTNYVGAATGVGGGGVLVSMNTFDKGGAFELSSEYGIRDIFLNLDYRRYQGFGDIDFSSNVFNVGVTVDF